MQILTTLKDIANTSVNSDVAKKISGNTIKVYTENGSASLDFNVAKNLAPILGDMELADYGEIGGSEVGMLLAAGAAAVLDDKKRAAAVYNGADNALHYFTVNGVKCSVKTCDDIALVAAKVEQAKEQPKEQPKKENKKEQPKQETKPEPVEEEQPEPEPVDIEEPDITTDDDAANITDDPSADELESLEVDQEALEAFMEVLPEDSIPEGISKTSFAKALFKSLADTTSDVDAAAKLESYIGGDADKSLRIIKDRDVYDELRDIALTY